MQKTAAVDELPLKDEIPATSDSRSSVGTISQRQHQEKLEKGVGCLRAFPSSGWLYHFELDWAGLGWTERNSLSTLNGKENFRL